MARLEGVFLVSTTGRAFDGLIRRMAITQRARQVLRCQHINMVLDWQDFCLRMEMRFRSQFMASCDESESSVLDGLETANGRGFGVWRPDWCCIVQFCPYERFVSHEKCFGILSPRRARECLNYFEASSSSVGRLRWERRGGSLLKVVGMKYSLVLA